MSKQARNAVLKTTSALAAPADMMSAPAPACDAQTEMDIATLAYQIWEQRGRPDGNPESDWYEAERLMSARNNHTQLAPST